MSNVAYRMLMAASLPRLAAHPGRAPRAVARALRTTALARLPEDENGWTRRIEARRHELASGEAVVRPEAVDARRANRDAVPVGLASSWISLPPVLCVFLMRLVRELGPSSCVELGTGFGISAAYQAASLELNGEGRLETFESVAGFAGIARQGFSALGLSERVELRVGPIEETLGEAAERMSPLEYAFVDADHTARATVEQFELMLPHMADGAVVVFDDINWPAMTAAWRRIRRHQGASLALGLRRLGVVVVSRRAGHSRPVAPDEGHQTL